MLNELQLSLSGLLDTAGEIIVTRAPGRLDVMGGIADYSGSLVLEMPIAEATFAAIQRNSRKCIEIRCIDRKEQRSASFRMDLADLRDEEPGSYVSARNYFAEKEGGDWASYIAGAFFVLGKELGIRFCTGASLLVASNVPIGKGVSSSAALEVSTMHAICSAYAIDRPPR